MQTGDNTQNHKNLRVFCSNGTRGFGVYDVNRRRLDEFIKLVGLWEYQWGRNPVGPIHIIYTELRGLLYFKVVCFRDKKPRLLNSYNALFLLTESRLQNEARLNFNFYFYNFTFKIWSWS